MKDIYQKPEVKDFLDQFDRNGLPKIISSAMVIAINDGRPDPKMCLEIGAAVLLDKPIVITAMRGKPVPKNLQLVATRIIEIENPSEISESEKALIEDAIYEVMSSIEKAKEAVILAIAHLAIERPGWDDMLGRIADNLYGKKLYEEFKEMATTARKLDAERLTSSEILTLEGVVKEMEAYFDAGNGNPILRGPMALHIVTKKDVPLAVLESLKLERITAWKRRS